MRLCHQWVVVPLVFLLEAGSGGCYGRKRLLHGERFLWSAAAAALAGSGTAVGNSDVAAAAAAAIEDGTAHFAVVAGSGDVEEKDSSTTVTAGYKRWLINGGDVDDRDAMPIPPLAFEMLPSVATCAFSRGQSAALLQAAAGDVKDDDDNDDDKKKEEDDETAVVAVPCVAAHRASAQQSFQVEVQRSGPLSAVRSQDAAVGAVGAAAACQPLADGATASEQGSGQGRRWLQL